MECWDSLLLVHELLDGGAKWFCVEDTTICDVQVSVEVTVTVTVIGILTSTDEHHEEQGPGQVAPEA